MASVLYPGSFDPVTKGHVDVILRLKKIFDRVVVLVADSPRKNYRFSREERVGLIEVALSGKKGIEVKSATTLTVDFAKSEGIQVIARSARSVADWEYEYALAHANKMLAPEIETLFIMATPEHAMISSTLVREIAAFDGDTSPFVPKNVVEALKSAKNKNANKNLKNKTPQVSRGKK